MFKSSGFHGTLYILLFSLLTSWYLRPPFAIFLLFGLLVYDFKFRLLRKYFFEVSAVISVGALVVDVYMHRGISASFSYIAAFAVFIALSAATLRIVNRRYRLFTLLAILLLSFTLFLESPKSEANIRHGLWLFSFFWASSFFTLFIDTVQRYRRDENDPAVHIAPWFPVGLLPVGSRFFVTHLAKSEDELLASQRSGFVLVAKLSAIYFLLQWMNKSLLQQDFNFLADALYTISTTTEVLEVFTSFYSSLGLKPTATSVLTYYTVATLSLVRFLLTYGLGVAIARMFGFALPLVPYRWRQVDSISKFYGNILFYYNRLLVDAFLIPSFRTVSKYFGGELGRSVVTFFSIAVGGTFAHIVFAGRVLEKFNSTTDLLGHFAGFAIYATTLAVVLTASRFFHSKQEQQPTPLILFLIRLFLIVSMYTSIAYLNIHILIR